MKLSQRWRLAWLVLALLVVGAMALAACSPNPQELIISPQLGAQMEARAAGNQVVRAEPTPLPKLADLQPDQVTAGASPELIDALAKADPAKGQQLAQANGCLGCHSLDPNAKMTGPTWHNLGNTAVGRVPNESPVFYLDHSIVNPSEYVVPNYPDNIMPKNFGQVLSIQDQADIISFLLQQTQG